MTIPVWRLGSGPGPGTHALVVGVGRYPHLLNGDGPLYAGNDGMAQLTSAPRSATGFADWVAQSYRNAKAPLASLRVLASDPASAAPIRYQPKPSTPTYDLPQPTFDSFSQAVLDWFADLNTPVSGADANRAIFFFCGHGVASGFQVTLLLQDFGDQPAAVLRRALDFNHFYTAMDQCSAREQCYFIDACRVASPTLLQAASFGDPVLTPSRTFAGRPRRAPAFFSTLPGMDAYGRVGATSVFTTALLQALRRGAKKTQSGWTIVPTQLLQSLDREIDVAAGGSSASQACEARPLAELELHQLVGDPEVPVTVNWGPLSVPATSVLRVSGGSTNRDWPPPVPAPSKFELPPGQYDFMAVAKAPAATQPSVTEIVYPPYSDVGLP